MSIESDIGDAMESANVRAFAKMAPQHAPTPFTVWRCVESDPQQTIEGVTVITRSDYLFESWGATVEEATSQRDATVAAIEGATSLPVRVRIPPGEAALDPNTEKHMAPCAFAFWH